MFIQFNDVRIGEEFFDTAFISQMKEIMFRCRDRKLRESVEGEDLNVLALHSALLVDNNIGRITKCQEFIVPLNLLDRDHLIWIKNNLKSIVEGVSLEEESCIFNVTFSEKLSNNLHSVARVHNNIMDILNTKEFKDESSN